MEQHPSNPHPALINDSQRLLELTEILNLDDYDKLLCNVYSAFYPFVDDFKLLQVHVLGQRRACSCYGVDNAAFDQSAFRKMRVLVCHLAALPDAFEAYCQLKSQLFLEQNDFFDDVITRVVKRTACSASQAESERLMRAVLHIRDIYDIFL